MPTKEREIKDAAEELVALLRQLAQDDMIHVTNYDGDFEPFTNIVEGPNAKLIGKAIAKYNKTIEAIEHFPSQIEKCCKCSCGV